MANLTDKEKKAIELVIEGKLTRNEICKEVGYKNRSSIYYLLEKDEAQEYMQKLADRSVSEAVSILKGNANDAARNLVRISQGNISKDDKQVVYASLQAINSILEKSGLSSKNITLTDNRDKENKVSDKDILDAIEELEEE